MTPEEWRPYVGFPRRSQLGPLRGSGDALESLSLDLTAREESDGLIGPPDEIVDDSETEYLTPRRAGNAGWRSDGGAKRKENKPPRRSVAPSLIASPWVNANPNSVGGRSSRRRTDRGLIGPGRSDQRRRALETRHASTLVHLGLDNLSRPSSRHV